MPRFPAARIAGFVIFLVMVGASSMLDQREAFRFWGVGLLAASLVATFLPRIPVRLGYTELRPLEGWRKAYVLVPTYIIGITATFFPHEVACAVRLKGYICA
jgi:hypothetical protein